MVKYTQLKARELFAKIAAKYDFNNTLFSLGIHHLWKRRLVKKIKERLQGGQLVDLCTGTGNILALVGADVSAVGVDICEEMLCIAQKKVPAVHKLICADVLKLPLSDNTADVVSIAFGLRNLSDFEKGLEEIKRITKADGDVFILEFGKPRNKLIASLFGFYSKYIMPFIGGLITGDKAAYTYLHQTSWSFPCSEEMCGILKKHGFKDVQFESLSCGIAYLYCAKV